MDNAFRVPALRAPPAPREVHSASRLNVATAGQLYRLFGLIWTALGFSLAVLFTVLTLTLDPAQVLGVAISSAAALGGALTLGLGEVTRRRAHALLRDGVEAEGQVTRVGVDPYARMNGRRPWRVEYTFVDGSGATVKGATRSWNPARPVVTDGDLITVIYDPKHPSRSVPWTPLHEDPADASRAPRDADRGAVAGASLAPRDAAPAGAPGVRVELGSADARASSAPSDAAGDELPVEASRENSRAQRE